MNTTLKVNKLCKSFGNTKVLKDLSFEVFKGEEVALVGPSGSGKSTLLHLIGALDKPDSGEIILNEENIVAVSDERLAQIRNEKIGFVFQFHYLLPSMSNLDNILLPARIGNRNLQKIESHCLSLANILGVAACLKKYPYEISGGEQQRINLIRALSMSPEFLLCDEPTGNLDTENTQIVINLLKNLAKQHNATLLVVTHDLKVASQLNRKITIEDGRIIS